MWAQVTTPRNHNTKTVNQTFLFCKRSKVWLKFSLVKTEKCASVAVWKPLISVWQSLGKQKGWLSILFAFSLLDSFLSFPLYLLFSCFLLFCVRLAWSAVDWGLYMCLHCKGEGKKQILVLPKVWKCLVLQRLIAKRPSPQPPCN
jgi:hypothetical protein